MNSIEIGKEVSFSINTLQFKGTVVDIAAGICFVAVLGYPDTYKVVIDACTLAAPAGPATAAWSATVPMSCNDTQAYCEKLGKPAWVHYDGDANMTYYPVGLCPRCSQPIVMSFANGGKLSAARTLDLRHLFSGNTRCEDELTNQNILAMTGQEKADFFVKRHTESVFRQAGFTEAEIRQRMDKLMQRTP